MPQQTGTDEPRLHNVLRNTYLREAKPSSGNSKAPSSTCLPPPLHTQGAQGLLHVDRVQWSGNTFPPHTTKLGTLHHHPPKQLLAPLLRLSAAVGWKGNVPPAVVLVCWEVQHVEHAYVNSCNKPLWHTSVQNHCFNFCPVK